MVQKKSAPVAPRGVGTAEAGAPRRRGRPRAFKPEVALAKALDAFRDTGFSATSLDDLSAAMGINRPSLYGTFGDKRELFIKAYDSYRQEMAAIFAEAFDPALSLRQMLEAGFRLAIDVYLSGEKGARGCFTVMTAASEAMSDPEIRGLVQASLESADKRLAARFRLAVAQGELPTNANCDALARLVSATIQSIAIRARAGIARAELERLAKDAINLVAPVKRPVNGR